MTWLAFVTGLILGTFAGVFLCGLLTAARDHRDPGRCQEEVER
jgi:hypothetical protein